MSQSRYNHSALANIDGIVVIKTYASLDTDQEKVSEISAIHRCHYDAHGCLVAVGQFKVSYNHDGRISHIGSFEVTYDEYDNRIAYVGSLFVEYEEINGCTQIKGVYGNEGYVKVEYNTPLIDQRNIQENEIDLQDSGSDSFESDDVILEDDDAVCEESNREMNFALHRFYALWAVPSQNRLPKGVDESQREEHEGQRHLKNSNT